MRIRSVKPEYWQHRMHKRLSVSASLLGAALLDYADDEGRFEAEGARIRGMLVPSISLEKEVDALVKELEGVGWLCLYAAEMDGVEVEIGQIVAFELHQVIQRPKRSLLPAPPKGWGKVAGKWLRLGQGTEGTEGTKRTNAGGVFAGVNDSSLTEPNMADGSVNEANEHDDGGDTNMADGSVNDQSLGNGRKGEERKGVSEHARAGEAGIEAEGAGGTGVCVEQSGVEQLEVSDSGVGFGREAEKRGQSDGSGSGARGAARPTTAAEAVIPTVEEVVLAGERCVPAKAPEGYCRWWWRKFPSVMGGWLRRGFLMDWEWELGNWWRRDQAVVLAGEHASCEESEGLEIINKGANPGGARGAARPIPRWKRIKELESREGPIWTHVANRESAFYSKRLATLAARKELGKLYGEMATLKAAEGGEK